MRSTSFRWGAFAAIGLAVAVAVALLATQLVSEKIGISSEPVSAGESLAPERVEHHPKRRRHRAGNTQVQTTFTTPAAPTAGSGGSGTPESADDNSGGSTESEPGDD